MLKLRAWVRAGTTVALCLPLAAVGQPAPVSALDAPTTVLVDFGKSQGKFPHPERNNNWSRPHNNAPLRAQDVRFFNAQGLHGRVYRTWVDVERINPVGTDAFDFNEIHGYLDDLSKVTDNLLIVLDTRVSVRDFKRTPEQIRPAIKKVLLDLKARYPMIRYIEAFNEPDHNLARAITKEQLYDYYKVYYEVVNEVNRELKLAVPLEIGGPAFMQYNPEWMAAFLDRYKADPSPNKKLDFVSWHSYGEFPVGTGDKNGPRAYRFYKTDPSEVATHRKLFEAELRKRGLSTKIPSFITELGIYPGPSFDTPSDPVPDYLIGAAGVPSLLYWLMESPYNVPFNWVPRHLTEERKDQLVTRGGADRKTPQVETFTPYGNAMAMMAKLGETRVLARSSALSGGKGVYALATRDKAGLAVMTWNYQHTGKQTYRARIDLQNLPPAMRRASLCQRLFRIDDKISNYWANSATANLQQVSAGLVRAGGRHAVDLDLTPNALVLITLEPAKACAAKSG